MSTPLPNRIAVYLAAFTALVGGLAPLVGNLDWTSTAGIVAALGAISAVVYKWLDGWQQYEARSGDELVELDDDEIEFDEGAAEPIPDELVKAAQLPADPVG